MTENLPDLADVRTEITEAQSAGDVARANAAYAKELELRAKPPQEQQKSDAPTVDSKSQDYLYTAGLVTTEDLKALGELEGDRDVIALSEIVGSAVRELRAQGRSIAVKNVSKQKVDEFLEDFSDDEVRGIVSSVVDLPRALAIAGKFIQIAIIHHPNIQVPEDYVFWKIALPVVERIYNRLQSNAKPSVSTTPAEAGTRDEYLSKFQEFEKKIAEFQARGMHRDANRTYAEQQSWIAAQLGDTRIVGSDGRWA